MQVISNQNDHLSWLNGQEGDRANLSGADLQVPFAANLRGADLSDFADLSGANLRGANLCRSRCQFARCQFARCRFARCPRRCQFARDADLF